MTVVMPIYKGVTVKCQGLHGVPALGIKKYDCQRRFAKLTPNHFRCSECKAKWPNFRARTVRLLVKAGLPIPREFLTKGSVRGIMRARSANG